MIAWILLGSVVWTENRWRRDRFGWDHMLLDGCVMDENDDHTDGSWMILS